jgi:electron transfer flavoprotein beta subunit
VRILALVKYSIDASEVRVDPATGALRLANVPRRFGDIDKNVIEAAVRVKESAGGSVGIVCVGPPGAVAGLKSVMAMGVDDAVIVEEPFAAVPDRGVVVRILEAAVGVGEPYDLLMCGFASDDGYSGQVGPRLAERLGLPFVSYARDIRTTDAALEVDQDYGDRVRIVRCALPAMVAVAEESFPPRPITLLQAMKAQKRPLRMLKIEEDLGLSAAALQDGQALTEVSRRGVVVPRRQVMLTGQNTAELADRLIDALVQEDVVVEVS